jgi:drug/metabolite transporter (DMT)-like permease
MINPILMAFGTACSMACGQILFKIGSKSLTGNGLMATAVEFVTSPFLLFAIFLYAFTIIAWIYVLRVLPLSVAYPITALSYLIVPIISYFILDEQISLRMIAGSILIVLGVVVSNYSGGQ